MSKYTSNSFLHFKLRKRAFLAIKLAIVFGSGYFIYNKLMYNDNLHFDAFLNAIKKHEVLTLQNGLLLLLLSSINWVLESLKWKTLVNEVVETSLFKALEQTLGSLTASIFTPNRIGEYGAKALYFKKGSRKKVLGFTLVGNLLQLLVTILVGWVGFVFFIQQYNPQVSYYRIVRVAVFGLLFAYFFLTNTPKSRFQIKGYTFSDLKRFLSSITPTVFWSTFSMCILRYVVFSFQFYFLLILFKVNITYWDAMILISSFYLIVSVIPTIFILDILVKGSVALWLFSFIEVDEVHVLSVILLMWLLNFAVPSVIGSYFVLTFKISDK